MAESKKVIIKFKKGASADDKARAIEDLKTKGGEITNQDSLNSSIFPFVAATLPEEHFHSLHSETVGGSHHVVDHVEEDGEVRIQQ